MNLELNEVNKLPVRTWSGSGLGVNDITIQDSIPDIKPYGKEPFLSGKSQCDDISIKRDAQKADFVPFINTGMGADAVNFIQNNKNSGISIRVPSGIRIKDPIYLEYKLDKENPTVVDLNHIIAEENSEVTVVMSYRSEEGCAVFHGGLTFLQAGKDAVINLVQIQLLSENALHLNNIGAFAEENGKINVAQGELGGYKAINGLCTDLKGNKSRIDINTIFFGDKNRSIDINYVVNHIGRQSQSDMAVNGALLDESSKVFRGTIDFKKGAAGAAGQEGEYILLFSPNIKNVSAPLILCKEESVEGKHAANSGRIDDDKLFYMMSRGMDELSAKKLIIEAWFQPVIDKIPYEGLQRRIMEYVKERLSHVESI